MKRFPIHAALALTLPLTFVLQACAPVVLGGAVVGTMVAADRRTSGSQLEDEGIELRAASRLREALGDRVHINVSSYNRQALLTGEVASAQDRQQAEQIVAKVDNVRATVNELAILGTSTLSQRASDAFTTSKVKASLIDAKDLYAAAFKVTTERGVVYLMGRVTQREAQRATEIARSIDGVQKVIRVLELISEEELRQIRSAPAKASGTPAPQRAP